MVLFHFLYTLNYQSVLSKNHIKLINSLKQKKFRMQHRLFISEGIKNIDELIHSDFILKTLYTTKALNSYANTIPSEKLISITENELKKISYLKTPNTALALFTIPELQPVNDTGLILALDSINDPGNLGTIIRLCDWFGIKSIVCSKETVDCFNPKVVQASMGSIARVHISYVDLEDFLKTSQKPVFGAFMEGENVYKMDLPKEGILVLGNEANGISKTVEALITQKISIPQFGNNQDTESLNVATATAILLSEFRRSL